MTAPRPDTAALSAADRELGAVWSDVHANVAALVAEVLLAMGESQSAIIPHAQVERRREVLGLALAAGSAGTVRPLDVLRRGPDDAREAAVLSVLVARHVARDGFPRSATAHLASLDWLEFTGPYAPYAALDVACPSRLRESWRALLAETLPDGPPAHRNAVAAVRGVALASPSTPPASDPVEFNAPRVFPPVTIEGRLGPPVRSAALDVLATLTGVSLVRGFARNFARIALSARAPAVLTLDGPRLHLTAHRELLGRVTRTIESRHAVVDLAVVEQQTRFARLPLTLAVALLLTGTLLGARAAFEGTGAVYFPLLALGLGLMLGGVACEWLVRALWPALRGRTRLLVRPRNGAAFEIDELDPAALARLLDALDARSVSSSPRRPTRP